MKHADGHVASGGLSALGKTDARRIFYPVEGVVTKVHYIEDSTNKSKTEIEYDVDVTSMSNMGRLKNVPRAYTEGGVDDGSEGVLTAANTTTDKTDFVIDSGSGKDVTPRFATNGDIVVVQFINGNVFTPVIMAVRQHKARRRKKLAKPQQNKLAYPSRTHAFRGNTVDMDGDGNVTVKFGKTTKSDGTEGEDKKKLTVTFGDFEITVDNSSSPTTITFGVPNGPAVKFTKDDFQVGAAGLEPMVMGDALSTWLNNLKAAFNSHTHSVNGSGLVASLTTGNVSGLATSAAPTAFTDTLDVKSNYAKVSKNKP